MNDIMNGWLSVLVSVVVGAGIGGVTNHLAIKMLFHPRRRWRVGGLSVPFTPGLIPKRRDDIGHSLGQVVSDHLVTSHGLAGMLEKSEIRNKLETRLTVWIEDWTSREETVAAFAARFISPEQMERLRESGLAAVRRITVGGVDGLWDRYALDEARLADVVPGWTPERKEELAAWGAETFSAELRRELMSPSGDRLIRQLTGRLLEQAGGFLGTMAAIFMDEDKIAQKIKLTLSEQLDSPVVRQAVGTLLERKIGELESWTLSDAVRRLTGEDARLWVAARLESALPWEEWLERLSAVSLRQLASPFRETFLDRVPQAAGWAVGMIGANIGKIVQAVQLPKLVEEQVEKFPIERLEEIILSVSGREFRAITWLGVLLGALIGLVQPLMNFWFY